MAALALLAFMAILATHVFHLMMVEQRNSRLEMHGVAAFEAAQAGLDEARAKMSKCFTWLSLSANQKVFVLSNEVSTEPVRVSYRVQIEPVSGGIRVTSRGIVGPLLSPLAQRQVTAVFDVASGRYTQFMDWGSL